MKRGPFTVLLVADVSTKHITKEDGELALHPLAPYHLANTDDQHGSLFYVPLDAPVEDIIDELHHYGFSSAFRAIFKELREENIPYVRFDGDAAEVTDYPVFEW